MKNKLYPTFIRNIYEEKACFPKTKCAKFIYYLSLTNAYPVRFSRSVKCIISQWPLVNLPIFWVIGLFHVLRCKALLYTYKYEIRGDTTGNVLSLQKH